MHESSDDVELQNSIIEQPSSPKSDALRSLCACSDSHCEARSYMYLLCDVYSRVFELLVGYYGDKKIEPQLLLRLTSSLLDYIVETSENNNFVRFVLGCKLSNQTEFAFLRIFQFIKNHLILSPR